MLLEHGNAARLLVSQSIDEARSALDALPPESRVVLVGGDGTVHHMLPALLRGRHELGLVPFGSGNDTARAMGLLDMSLQQALVHALSGAVSLADMGLVRADTHTPIPFISSLAAGFDAAIAQRAHHSPKWLIGLPRYLYATLLELHALERNDLSLSIDGVAWGTRQVLFSSVLNTPTYGSGMPAVPQARMNDGALNLLVAGKFGRLGALMMLPRLLMGRHLSHAQVSTQAFTHLSITSTRPLPLAADGEPLPASLAVEVQVNAAVLPVVMK